MKDEKNFLICHGKKFFYTCMMIMISAVIGALALMVVYTLPTTGNMFKNAQQGRLIYEKEEVYPSWAPGNTSAYWDNYTDSIMLRTALFPEANGVVHDAMLNPRYCLFQDLDSKCSEDMDTVFGTFQTNKDEDVIGSILEELKGNIQNMQVSYYSRYWNGYLVWLKPLLLAMPISQIRMWNGMLQICLACYLFCLIFQKLGIRYSWAFLLSYLALNPISVAISFQFSDMFYLLAGFSIYVLHHEEMILAQSRYIYMMAMAGILTAYFDFLTYPLVSYGFPMTMLILLAYKGHRMKRRVDGAVFAVTGGTFWCLGYGGMYISKWIMSWLLTGHNTWAEAVGQTMYRMSGSLSGREGSQVFSVWEVIDRNVGILAKDPVILLFLVFLAILLWKMRRYHQRRRAPECISAMFGLLLLSVAPFVWLAVFANHSWLHFWMTYRELSLFIFAFGSLFIVILEDKETHGARGM